MRPGKAQIAAHFSGAAASYDRAAEVQTRAVRWLQADLPSQLLAPKVWELGVGTGALTERLIGRYPGAEFIGWDLSEDMLRACRERWPASQAQFLCADAERARAPEGVGLVASSFALQWFHEPEAFLRRAARAAVPGGALALSLPVQPTLSELSEVYEDTLGRPFDGLRYPSAAAVLNMVERSGWQLGAHSERPARLYYASAFAALSALKEVGAQLSGSARAPLGPRAMKALLSAYQERSGPEGVPLSYQVLCVHATRR